MSKIPSKEKPQPQPNSLNNLDQEDLKIMQDSLFSSTPRFSIMLVLSIHRKIGFTELRQLLQFTPGNLDYHTKSLIEAGFVRKYTKLALPRSLTMFAITNEGIDQFQEYTRHLKSIIPDFF